jgi:transposase
MSNDSAKCPSCGGQLSAQEKSCPHCGRWMAARGIAFYTFWTALSLVGVALIAYIFYGAFLVMNRML